MNRFLTHILTLILLSMPVFLVSCLEKEAPATGVEEKESLLTLNIKPTTRASRESEIECIESVRVILIDRTGKVKVNELKEFPQTPALNFSTEFNLLTQEGPFNVYVIANENSITDFKVEGDETDYSSISFSDQIERFTAGRGGFESFINAVYYTPDLSKPLPMSSMYAINVEAGGQSEEIYLVNTTTKFDIYFNNYRNSTVTFNSVGIDKVADEGYLMASIEPEYLSVNNMYWIDWMKKVVEETNLHPDLDDTEDSNNLINEKLGWLTNYNVPESAVHGFVNFIDQDEDSETWEMEAATPNIGELPTPSEMKKGPFYYPESKYIPSTSASQTYSLVIEVNSLTEGTQTLKRELEYIRTLFRNTHVILHVDMYTGSEDIYAEIIKWGENGWVYGQIKPE